jgi:hypothetical protein
MAHYLSKHPQVFIARKEMHLFGSDLLFSRHFYRRGRAAYLAEFSGRREQLRAGDASVWYLFSRWAAEEIHEFNPEARIVVMLREPSEMLYSLYSQFRFDGNEELSTFEEALEAEPDRRAGKRIPRRAYLPQGLLYRDVCRYSQQVRRYFEIFGRSHVKVVLFDELLADASAAYRDTADFLGVDVHCGPREFAVVNGNKGVKHQWLHAVLSEPLVRSFAMTVHPLLPDEIIASLHWAESRLKACNTRTEQRVPLHPETRARLKQEFAGEVRELAGLLGLDLSHWSN